MKSSSSYPHPKNSLENPLTFWKSCGVIITVPPKKVLYISLERQVLFAFRVVVIGIYLTIFFLSQNALLRLLVAAPTECKIYTCTIVEVHHVHWIKRQCGAVVISIYLTKINSYIKDPGAVMWVCFYLKYTCTGTPSFNKSVNI